MCFSFQLGFLLGIRGLVQAFLELLPQPLGLLSLCKLCISPPFGGRDFLFSSCYCAHTVESDVVVFSNHVAPSLLAPQVLDLSLALRQLSFQISLYVGWDIVGLLEPPLDVSSALFDLIQ